MGHTFRIGDNSPRTSSSLHTIQFPGLLQSDMFVANNTMGT